MATIRIQNIYFKLHENRNSFFVKTCCEQLKIHKKMTGLIKIDLYRIMIAMSFLDVATLEGVQLL